MNGNAMERMRTLDDFEVRARAAARDYLNVELFRALVADAPGALSISQRELADLLEVSPASVTRYAQGKNAPHPTLRRFLCDRLADHARDRSRELERESRPARRASAGFAGYSIAARGRG